MSPAEKIGLSNPHVIWKASRSQIAVPKLLKYVGITIMCILELEQREILLPNFMC